MYRPAQERVVYNSGAHRAHRNIQSNLNHVRCFETFRTTMRNLKVFAHRSVEKKKYELLDCQSVRQTAPSTMDPTTPSTPVVTTPDSSSSEFSSADFTIGSLFQQPNLEEKQAEEVYTIPKK